jgi:RsiG-like
LTLGGEWGLYSPLAKRTQGTGTLETFPDLGALSDQELKGLIEELTNEEQEVSYQRRILHGKIDILRAELVNRLRRKHEEGEAVISGDDVQQLTDILAGKTMPEPPTDD